jgi:hypothetical protein
MSKETCGSTARGSGRETNSLTSATTVSWNSVAGARRGSTNRLGPRPPARHALGLVDPRRTPREHSRATGQAAHRPQRPGVPGPARWAPGDHRAVHDVSGRSQCALIAHPIEYARDERVVAPTWCSPTGGRGPRGAGGGRTRHPNRPGYRPGRPHRTAPRLRRPSPPPRTGSGSGRRTARTGPGYGHS